MLLIHHFFACIHHMLSIKSSNLMNFHFVNRWMHFSWKSPPTTMEKMRWQNYASPQMDIGCWERGKGECTFLVWKLFRVSRPKPLTVCGFHMESLSQWRNLCTWSPVSRPLDLEDPAHMTLVSWRLLLTWASGFGPQRLVSLWCGLTLWAILFGW